MRWLRKNWGWVAVAVAGYLLWVQNDTPQERSRGFDKYFPGRA